MAMACPEESKISEFVSRALQTAVVAQIEAHLADCGDCRDLVYALAGADEQAAVERIGRFELVELIGHGAMGSVYRARDPELDRQVAVKMRRGNARLDVAAEDRLRREAQALAKLTHPNVVAVYETGRAGEIAYVAMELVEGVTLDRWLDATRSQTSVLELMIGAGRGLAAAHEAGLIHRDFKPQNVFVSKTDVAKVGDFGLVRVGQSDARAIAPTSDLVVTLSVAGSIIGTPAYMAPEQLRGEIATEASDQFSFCVALYEALYGARPFTGTTVDELVAAMEQGVKLPARPRVPRRVRKALVRGLAYKPAERFLTMLALLAALSNRRSTLAWAAAGTAIAAAVAAGVLAMGPRDEVCSGSERELSGIWDAQRRDAVIAAFRATGVEHAAEVAARTSELLDGRAKSWILAHRDACRATRVHESQPESVLALRNGCLAERRAELRALTDLLVRADASTIENAIDATAALERVDQCADISALQQVVRPPADPVKRMRVEALRVELAHVRVLMNLASAERAVALARPLVAATQELGYAPLYADALIVLAGLLHDGGKDTESIQLLRKAAATADAAADDRARFDAYESLIQILRYSARVDQLDDALLQLRGIFERTPYDAGMHHRLLLLEGYVLVAKNQPNEAIGKYRELIAAIENTGRDDDAPELATAYMWLADALARADKADEVDAAAKRAGEVFARVYGQTAADQIEMRSNAEQSKLFEAMLLVNQHKAAEALPIAQAAAAKLTQLHGPDHGAVGLASHVLGLAYYDLGKLDEARLHHRRALEIHRRILGNDDIKVAASLGELARIDFDDKQFADSVQHFSEARDIYSKARGPDFNQAVGAELWIARGLMALGKLDAAAAHLARAREVGGELGNGPVTAVLEAELLVARGKPGQAIAALDKAFAGPAGRRDWIGHGEHVWARALIRAGRRADAIPHAERAFSELEARGKQREAGEVRALLDSLR